MRCLTSVLKITSGGVPLLYFLRGKGFKVGVVTTALKIENAPSDGLIKVVFAPEGRGTEPLTDSEMSSVRWVIDHEASISSDLLASLLKDYASLQNGYGYSGDEKAELMPDIKSVEDFRNLIGLHAVNIY